MADETKEQQKPKSLPSTKTPEPRLDQQLPNGHGNITPDTPGVFPSFDWEDFEARYEKALVDADEKERELLQEFEGLVKYFNVWASTSSAHDNDRAVKRLHTRQRFVNIQEENMAQKQRHMTEVLHAFQTNMATVCPDQPRAQLAIPNISNDELVSFFESHFSDAAIQKFSTDFLSPEKNAGATDASVLYHGDVGEEDYYEEEEDDLGYYPDGVKRTLTDEQIAMFRHSEIEALRKEEEKTAERRAAAPQQTLESGEVGDHVDTNDTETYHQPSKTKNKKKRKAGKAKNQEPKPDLRKRTWDVVEAGLDSLDYD
ncbi:hypothetical protein CkaCkLH20_06620 [Colletotrichum karsti]|uniref:Uncharacterized protein n=1 Tax=Colletotrichum karsti TaxID=1095194 RepID=A0A9P6I3D0_9PEZI|nr:uncharacterized protein CkaCkLH20_06620 [Colletotrichum karsti]KAF9875688.1 hypothetical protein CkaCkLH20_06620 [Colletotrichum karsti]